MKIIPLVLVMGAAPLMAQSPAARPKAAATPAKASEKAAEKEEAKEEKKPRRYRRVSRNAAPPPRPVVVREEEKPAPASKPKAAPKEEEVAEAQPRKRGGPFSFIGKIFGGGREKAAEEAQTAEVVGPPAPTPAPRRESRSAPSRQQIAAATQEVDDDAYLPTHSQRPTPEEPPVSVHRTVSNARGEMVPVDLHDDLPGGSSQPQSAPVYVDPTAPEPEPEPAAQAETTPPPATAAPFDRARYREVRQKAAADPAVAGLGEKLNATTPGDATHESAARAYTTALFGKMRELDPEQADWINRMESATVRRIEAGKPVLAE